MHAHARQGRARAADRAGGAQLSSSPRRASSSCHGSEHQLLRGDQDAVAVGIHPVAGAHAHASERDGHVREPGVALGALQRVRGQRVHAQRQRRDDRGVAHAAVDDDALRARWQLAGPAGAGDAEGGVGSWWRCRGPQTAASPVGPWQQLSGLRAEESAVSCAAGAPALEPEAVLHTQEAPHGWPGVQ